MCNLLTWENKSNDLYKYNVSLKKTSTEGLSFKGKVKTFTAQKSDVLWHLLDWNQVSDYVSIQILDKLKHLPNIGMSTSSGCSLMLISQVTDSLAKGAPSRQKQFIIPYLQQLLSV
ncbi:hypothetical protein CEXT_165851 [Caerostris extrusa]|uniref:Uncharacterized protein n=1 Tax=Caerostris extrusa TaxID=172846 RepID=A0AAV4MBZ4_CAEEX|nr:hypothetical protein CEXT_165851 [Caerostris extrusa]